MKKTLLVTLFLVFTFCLSLPGFSQVSWGIKGGASVANFKNRQVSYLGGNHNRLGFHAGLLAEINLNKKIFLQPELLYSLKGWRAKDEGVVYRGRVNFHYIDLPLLAGYRLSDKLSLLAGPGFGYLVNGKAFYSTVYGPRNRDITGEYKRLDVGISGAASYKFTPRLGVQVSYSYGLRRIRTIGVVEENGNLRNLNSGNNRVLQMSAYYLLKTKR